ncbi:MAG: sulfatase-like hydrolase/transferase [Verrucomicrobia bacterium]|nr:sulfatase-like hydrolase/transferase [Verrucomicrobiota bacterium]
MADLTAFRVPFVLLLAAVTAVAAESPASPAGKYNVLFLMTDEHNAGVLGCYGDPVVQTPTLDALAATGVRFTAAYCQNPICVPSRVSLVSGRMPSNLGTFGNTANQKYAGITTLADLFVRAGYATAWFGKTHWGDPRFPEHGAGSANKRAAKEERDESFGRLPQESQVSKWPKEKNPEHLTANEALAFLEQHRDRRFFLGVSFVKPHFPFTIQPEFYERYRGRVTPPRAPPELIAQLPALSREERAKYDHAGATAEEVLRTKAIYYGMVSYVDEEFGRIVRRLEQLGLRENTLIVYTADHGEMLGERGIWYKNSFYEGSARVPFLWSLPGRLPRGRVVTTPAMNLDILPTLADLCGLPIPAGVEGSSLAPVLLGTGDGAERIALSENYRGNYAGRMIRTARWKYFFYTTGEEYLYDLTADPGEETNLAQRPEHREIAAELKQRASAGWVQAKRGVREIFGASAGDRPARKKKRSEP